MVIADATARARERPPPDAKRLWSAPPKSLLPDAKRLWSAEIHLHFQVAHYSYTVMCISRGDARLESGAEVGFAAPPGSALQGGRAIFWCDAGEQGKTGKADAALLRFSVAIKVMAAATRLLPEAKIRVAYF